MTFVQHFPCPGHSDQYKLYSCLMISQAWLADHETPVSICHIMQYCEISLKKVVDHPEEVGDPNGVESCQKSIGTIRCNLSISYNNWERSLIFWTHEMNDRMYEQSHRQHAAWKWYLANIFPVLYVYIQNTVTPFCLQLKRSIFDHVAGFNLWFIFIFQVTFIFKAAFYFWGFFNFLVGLKFEVIFIFWVVF